MRQSDTNASRTDVLTPAQRRRAMVGNRASDTSIELRLRSALHRRGWRFRKNDRRFPGTPDIVFARPKVVVFVDGDFWHGYCYPSWKQTLSEFWRNKIEANRRRDRRNFQRLRRAGWIVLRIWEHEILRDLPGAVRGIEEAICRRRHGERRPA